MKVLYNAIFTAGKYQFLEEMNSVQKPGTAGF